MISLDGSGGMTLVGDWRGVMRLMVPAEKF
jgi:hypothetical protein